MPHSKQNHCYYVHHLGLYCPLCLRSLIANCSVAVVKVVIKETHTHTHTHPFNSPLSGTTRVGRYQKGQTNLDFIEARDSECQWHQLDHTQVCSSLQADPHAPLSFLQAGCPSCRPTNSVNALKASCY